MRGALVILGALLAPGIAAAGPQASFTLRFDLLSPAGMTCAAEAPGGSVRSGRDLKGAPLITITGDLGTARVTCTAPDGTRWQTGLPRPAPDPLAASIEGVAVYRPGTGRLPLLVRADRDHYSPVQLHHFTRLP